MNSRRDNKEYLRYSSVGIELVLFVLIFFGCGHWVDRKFGTLPVFSLVGGLIGIIAGFYVVFRTIASSDKRSGNSDMKTPK
jgi:F0F1-type ATP synthase assembly protein I